MSWIYAELVAVSLAAMLSPTTLIFSVLALVLGDRPLRTGLFFYIGALTATLAVGVAAAFVLGDVAASETPSTRGRGSQSSTWSPRSFLLVWVGEASVDRAREPGRQAVNQMGKVASSPAIAVVGAGAALANPGAFIPIALKTISETDPTTAGYAVQWLFFALVSLLPLLVAIVLLLVAPGWAGRLLAAAQGWLTRHAIQVAIVLVALLAVALLRNGIAGLTS